MNAHPAPDPDEERGAAERTDLSWTRSGLALLAGFAILARRQWTSGSREGDLLAVALLAAGALAWAAATIAIGHHRHRGGRRPVETPRRPAELLAVALGTCAVGATGIVIALVTPD